jgi:hypothetical protein
VNMCVTYAFRCKNCASKVLLYMPDISDHTQFLHKNAYRPYGSSKVSIFVSYPLVLLLRNMSEHRPRRAVVKKCKSALDDDSEQSGSGRSKRSINL